MNKYEQFVKKLSSGTTCKPFVVFIEEYRGYIIYHHKSHCEWLDRGYGNITCKAYLGYVKFDPDFDKVQWTTLFFQRKQILYIMKSKKSIEHIKTVIDNELEVKK